MKTNNAAIAYVLITVIVLFIFGCGKPKQPQRQHPRANPLVPTATNKHYTIILKYYRKYYNPQTDDPRYDLPQKEHDIIIKHINNTNPAIPNNETYCEVTLYPLKYMPFSELKFDLKITNANLCGRINFVEQGIHSFKVVLSQEELRSRLTSLCRELGVNNPIIEIDIK